MEEAETVAKEIISQMKIEKKTYSNNGKHYYVIINEPEIKSMIDKLHWLILRKVKDNYNSPEYTSMKENEISVMSDDGLIYDFYAFYGECCGGSEWEETYTLRVSCKNNGINLNLLSQILYSR